MNGARRHQSRLSVMKKSTTQTKFFAAERFCKKILQNCSWKCLNFCGSFRFFRAKQKYHNK
jgi:hypothetical protein